MLTNKLKIENKRVRRKLLKRARRGLRNRSRQGIERHIASFLGSEYPLIGNQIPGVHSHRIQKALNKSAYLSEVVFGRLLIKAEITNFFPNALLLNRFYGDFVFPNEGIVVEVDGSIHQKEDVKIKDARKTMWLERFGYKLFRVSSKDVEGMERIIEILKKELKVKTVDSGSNIRQGAAALPPALRSRKYAAVTSNKPIIKNTVIKPNVEGKRKIGVTVLINGKRMWFKK